METEVKNDPVVAIANTAERCTLYPGERTSAGKSVTSEKCPLPRLPRKQRRISGIDYCDQK
jgi:hypothetical protein